MQAGLSIIDWSLVALFLLADFADYGLAVPAWDQTERTTSCYDWLQQYLSEGYDADSGKDYVEARFDGDYSLTMRQATLKKYNYLYDALGLRPGMKLLDMGCGTGVWMDFCRHRGVDVTGLTLSGEQAKIVRRKGMRAHVTDYRDPIRRFQRAGGRFDRVTLFGSTEHDCQITGVLNLFDSPIGASNVRACNETRRRLFALVKSYLARDGKMFIASLVNNDGYRYTAYDRCQGYLMDRFYGGRYSKFSEYKASIQRAGFRIDEINDTTADYHYSAIADPDFFGCFTVKWHESTLNKLAWIVRGLLLDPFLAHKWLYYSCDTWQWQFGSSCDVRAPLTPEHVARRAVAQNKYFLCSPAGPPRRFKYRHFY